MTGILLSRAARAALAAAREPVRVGCPDCGGWAHVRGGRWRCQATHGFGLAAALGGPEYLSCGARGTVMPDGSLAVTRHGVNHERKEQGDG